MNEHEYGLRYRYGFEIISKRYMVGLRVKSGYGNEDQLKCNLLLTVRVVIDEKSFTCNGHRKPF
jgi:hypothetical protein